MKRFMAKKLTQEEFLNGVVAIHGDDIDFSKSIYINDATNVMCKCNKCGCIWWATPNNLKHGKGCPNCSHKSKKYTLDEWFKMAKKIHNDRYDLSLVKEYHSRLQKMEIICKEHGIFKIPSSSFLSGRGCPYCAINVIKEKQRKSLASFISDARQVHGDRYDYSKVKYINSHTRVCIMCPIHGEFWQTPAKHIYRGQGCSICNQSHLEKEVLNMLLNNGIESKQCKKFEWLGLQHLDFYLPKYNLAIECQGEQHYKSVEQFGGDCEFLKLQERDKRKKKLCEENGVKLLYFTHYKNVDENEVTFKDINKLLNEIFKYEL